MTRYELTGTIANLGFSSGHRFVLGRWDTSPIGPMTDVMWARPDGTRLLVVERAEVGQFITAVYGFDAVEITPIQYREQEPVVEVVAGDLRLIMRLGRRWRIPLAGLRRQVLFRPVERLLARMILGVRTFGVSPTGVREWYRADEYRPVRSAEGLLRGEDLGRLVPFHAPAGFGFSEPPRRPAVVRVRPLLDDPHGRLGEALGPEA